MFALISAHEKTTIINFMLTEEDTSVMTPAIEPESMVGGAMPTPHSYGTPQTTTRLVGNTFFGPDFNLDTFRGGES